MTCETLSEALYLQAPKLVVEIISPSTGRTDKVIKVPDYCSLASLDEVWLIDSRRPVMQDWQRLNGQWIGSLPLQPGQSFESRLLGGSIEVGDLFEGTGLEVADQEPKEALDRPDAQAEEGQS